MKETNDANIINTGVKSILDFGKDDSVPHFIYAGYHYLSTVAENSTWLQKMLLTEMKSNGLQYAILTLLYMSRWNLITKETVKKAYQGKLKNDKVWEDYEGSINDDLEKFFASLQDRKNIANEHVFSFFTPKLTEEEMKLVKERNEEHLRTYWGYYVYDENPDVDPEEMKRSDSRSKYLHGSCGRLTIPLTLE